MLEEKRKEKFRKELKIEIMENNKYTFERFNNELDNGYQIYFTYVDNRYLVFKTTENCYTQKLISVHDKNPQPRMQMITFKRLKEMFPYMTDIEYKIGTSEM